MIELSALEAAQRYPGDYRADLLALEQRIARLSLAVEAHRARVIILVEGWPAGGRAGVIEGIAAGWNPRRLRTEEVSAPGSGADGRHFLRPFWQMLPASGNALLLDGGWYGSVLAQRDPQRAARALDEINEFEAQITGDGTLLVKLYVHVTAATRAKRLGERLRDPWQRALIRPDELVTSDAADEVAALRDRILRDTDTRWAPWVAINGNSRKTARTAGLGAVADRLDRDLSSAPPEPDPGMAALLRDTAGGIGPRREAD